MTATKGKVMKITNIVTISLVLVLALLCVIALFTGYYVDSSVTSYGPESNEYKSVGTLQYFFKDGYENFVESLDTINSSSSSDDAIVLAFLSACFYAYELMAYLLAIVFTIIMVIKIIVNAVKFFKGKAEFKERPVRMLLAVNLIYLTLMRIVRFGQVKTTGNGEYMMETRGGYGSGLVMIIIAMIIFALVAVVRDLLPAILKRKNIVSKSFFSLAAVLFLVMALTSFSAVVSGSINEDGMKVKTSLSAGYITTGIIENVNSNDISPEFALALPLCLVLEITSLVIFAIAFGRGKENKGQVIHVIVLIVLSGIFLLIAGIMYKKIAVEFYDEGLKIATGIITYPILGIVTIAAYITGLVFQKKELGETGDLKK